MKTLRAWGLTFDSPAPPPAPVAPISPATLELMRRNLAARSKQHADMGDDHGAEVYRRLAEDIRNAP